MIPVIGIVDVLTGAFLLANRYVPLALLASFRFCSTPFYSTSFWRPAPMLFAVLTLLFNIRLIHSSRSAYQALLTPKPEPEPIALSPLQSEN